MEKSISNPRSLGFPLRPMLVARVLVSLSFVYGFLSLYGVYDYMPWTAQIRRAFQPSFIGHFALWIATFKIQGGWRFLLAVAMIPSILGVTLLWWMTHRALGVCAFAGMVWLFLRTIRGLRFGH